MKGGRPWCARSSRGWICIPVLLDYGSADTGELRAMRMDTVHIQLLGEFQVMIDNTPTVLNQTGQQTLLAYLLVHRHAPVARRTLVQHLFSPLPILEALEPIRKFEMGGVGM